MSEIFWDSIDWSNKLQVNVEISEEDALLQWEKSYNDILRIRDLEAEENIVDEVQSSLYEWLWIDEVLENNTDIYKFLKWVVDWLVVENIELVNQIIDFWIDKFIESLKQLLNPEIALKIIEQTGEEIRNIIYSIDEPYMWGLALWAQWLWSFWKIFKLFKKNNSIDIKEKEDLKKESYDRLDNKVDFSKLDAKVWTVINHINILAKELDINYILTKPSRALILSDNLYDLWRYISYNSNKLLNSDKLDDLKVSLRYMKEEIDSIVATWKLSPMDKKEIELALRDFHLDKSKIY